MQPHMHAHTHIYAYLIYTYTYNVHNVSIAGIHFHIIGTFLKQTINGLSPWHLSQITLTHHPVWLFMGAQSKVLVTVKIKLTYTCSLVALIWLGNFQVHLPSASLLLCPFPAWLGFISLNIKSNLAHIALNCFFTRLFSQRLDNSNWNNYL